MLYWILSVICIVTLHSCVASKYYYKEDNGNYDVYYGIYPQRDYKEFRPPKSYKVGYEDRGNRPGKCIRGEFKCDSPYPIAKTKFFECELDYQCPRFFKCCQIHCFQHRICQPIDLEASDDNNEVPTDASVIKSTSRVVTTQSSDSTQTTNSISTSISTRGGITITTQQPTHRTLEPTVTIKDKDIKQSTERSFTTTFKEATADNNEISTETSAIKTTSEVVSTQRTNSVSTQISTTESPTTLNEITTKASTTATVTIEDRSSSATMPYSTTSKTTQQSTLRSTQIPTTKRIETTTSKRLASTTMATNEDLQSTSIISTENSKTVDHRPPSSYTTISKPSTFQNSTTAIFETTTETYLPLDISSTGAEGTETQKKVSARQTLKPTTVVKNENSQFTTETPTKSSTMIDRKTNGKESTTSVIVDDHTVTSTFSSFTTSTVTESPTSIITKLFPTKTTEITIVSSSPTTTEDKETITRKEISTQYTLRPSTVRENEYTRSTSVTSTRFERTTGENEKDAGTAKKASSTVSSDQNGQEMLSDYTTSSKVLTTSLIPEMKTTKGKTTVTSNISVSPTFATQFQDNSTTKYSNTTAVKYGTTEPTAESVILQKTTTPETATVVEISSSITSRPPQDRTNPTTKFITQTTKLLDTFPVSITYKPTLQPESTTTAQKTSESSSPKKQTTLIIDKSTINNESLPKSFTIVNVEATTKTLDMLPDTSKQTRTSNEPAITSVVTIPDSTYKSTSNEVGTKSSTVEPFNNTASSMLDVTSSRLSSTSKATSTQMTKKSAIASITPHESTSERVTELSEPTDDEDLVFSGNGDDMIIQEKLTTTDDFTFSNEPSSRQEVPQSFLKSTYEREEAKGKEFYDSSTIGTIISEATRISTQYISHSTLSTLKSSTAVKDSPKLPDKHITIALEDSTVTTPKYHNNDEELLSSSVTIPEKLRTVMSKLDNSLKSVETSTKTSDGTSSERIYTTHDYFNATLEFKTTSPKSTAKVTQQPTSKSTDAENNSITSINTLLPSGSTPRTTHVKDVESTTNDRTVTTFPISEYPYGNKIYTMDRLLGTFRKLPSVHEKAGDGGDNYNFNNFLGFLDKISDLLGKRNDTVYNNLDDQTTTLSERSTSYTSGQGTTQAATKDKLTVMKIVEVEN